jgi:predicted ATPase
MIFLRSIWLKETAEAESGYPFDLPLIRRLDALAFPAPVTFFVGENGSGKSTLLEAIAAAIGSVTVGREEIERDETLAAAHRLAAHLGLSWTRRNRRGFFLRAEDFFNYARRTKRLVAELADLADQISQDQRGDWRRARGMILGERAALVDRYGEDPDARSHGESFLHLFQSRFVPGGLYLLDEPEAALSPHRQLALLAMLKEMVDEDAQFLIATHSPILMAHPGAAILGLDGAAIAPIPSDDVENVRLTRAFLANPEAFLRHL